MIITENNAKTDIRYPHVSRRICNYNLTHKTDLVMGTVPSQDGTDTHGICHSCYREVNAEILKIKKS